MSFQFPNATQLQAGLRALKTLAVVDGQLAEAEAGVIRAAQRVFGDDSAIDELAPITPGELAAAVEPPALRQQLFGGLVVMSMADGEVAETEAACVAAFAEAFGIEDGAVANLQRIAKGQLRTARLDIARRHWAPRKVRQVAAQEGPQVYVRAVLGMLNLKSYPEVIMRYQALGEMPAGSLGRAYFDYMVDNGFEFPGAAGAPPEAMIYHDFTHVLSGYGTTPDEEILAATFSAGYSSYERVNWLVFVLSQFQLGHPTAPNVPPARMQMNPDRLIAAFRRGDAMTIDINDGWDPWPVMAEPLEALRERYGIRPEAEFLPATSS